MIETYLTIEGDHKTYEIVGHAETTDICNGYSALLWTFVNIVGDQVDNLEYWIERSRQIIKCEKGIVTFEEGRGKDYNRISFDGSSPYENFFLEGMRLLSENYPESVAPLQTLRVNTL